MLLIAKDLIQDDKKYNPHPLCHFEVFERHRQASLIGPLQLHGIEWAKWAGILHPACLGLEKNNANGADRTGFCLDCRQTLPWDYSGLLVTRPSETSYIA